MFLDFSRYKNKVLIVSVAHRIVYLKIGLTQEVVMIAIPGVIATSALDSTI